MPNSPVPLDKLRTIGMRRECGGCTACCFVIEVTELRKPFRSICPHVVEGVGCAIWGGPGGAGGQPDVCAKYRCAWAMGFGNLKDQPNQSGILVDFRIFPLEDGTLAFYAIGVHDGDELTPEARQAMKNIANDSGWPIHLADRHLKVLEVIEPD